MLPEKHEIRFRRLALRIRRLIRIRLGIRPGPRRAGGFKTAVSAVRVLQVLPTRDDQELCELHRRRVGAETRGVYAGNGAAFDGVLQVARRKRHPPRHVFALRRRVVSVCSSFDFFILLFRGLARADERRDGGFRVEAVEPHEREPLVARQSHAVRRRAEEPARDALEGVAHDDGERRAGTERGRKHASLAPRARDVTQKKAGRVLVQQRETLEVGVLGDAHRARAGTRRARFRKRNRTRARVALAFSRFETLAF